MQDFHRSRATWLARRTDRNSAARPTHHSHRGRLTLEPLESRALLSLTTWTVNSLGDTGTGSGQSGDLRYCITQADQTSGNNTINFSVTGTITLYSALPDLSNTTGVMDIEGPGASSLTVARSSAAPDFSVFTLDSGVTASFTDLTISGGLSQSGGGGIDNAGKLTAANCTIDDNSVTAAAFGDGGGIWNNVGGTMTVTNSTIDNNSSGGIWNNVGGTMTVTNSTIADNTLTSGISNAGTLTVTNSTIDNNSAGSRGGGIDNGGTLTVTNSTIAYNSVGNYPAYGGYGGGIANSGTMTVTSSTIAHNNIVSIGLGGGLFTATPLSSTVLNNTLIALNTLAGGTPDDIAQFSGSTVSSTSAYNLIGTGGSGGLVNGINGNQVGVADPGLDPNGLQNNGGPTQTIALVTGSPAIGAGSNALAVDPTTGQPLTTDQRGAGFSRIVNNAVDIGAFEFQTTPTAATHLSLTVQPPGTVLTGSPFGLVVSAEDSSGVVTPSFAGNVTLALLNNPGGATLGGTVSVTAQNGVAIFTGLTLDKVGTGYTLQVSCTGLTAATTTAIDVQASGSPTHFTVDLTSDSGAGSGSEGDLRYAIAQADANTNPLGSLIQFDTTIFSSPQTITLTSDLPDLSNTNGVMDIQGPGASSVTVVRSNAAADFSVFAVDSNVTASLVGLTISGGLSEQGGGIDNAGTLSVSNSTIENDSANAGGGIYSTGTLTVTNSTFADNSVIDENAAGGAINNDGTLTVTNSTIADNSAYVAGGGIWNAGTLTVTNSTIADNFVGNGIGYSFGGGIANAATLTVNNTLIALNTSGGIGSGSTPDDISGTVSSTSAYNLIGTGGSGGLVNGVNGNQVGVADPGLDPRGLQNNGGPTQTIALLSGSPAIAAGSTALAVDPATGQPLATDQRGFPRIVGGTVDIGAFEVQSQVAAVAVDWGTQSATLQTASDGLRLLPNGRNTDLPWLGIDKVRLTLTQPATLAAGDISVIGSSGTNYGPVTVSGSGTSYTITLAQPINAADRVTITIGNDLIAPFTRRLDVLPGDVNDDGVVNVQDMVAIRNQMLGFLGAVPTLFGDINGDGKVDILDYTAVRMRIGTHW